MYVIAKYVRAFIYGEHKYFNFICWITAKSFFTMQSHQGIGGSIISIEMISVGESSVG